MNKRLLTAMLLSAVTLLGTQAVSPEDKVTTGDVVVATSRLYGALHGDSSVENIKFDGSNYSAFADYAVENGIISENVKEKLGEYITKAQTATIFSSVLPDEVCDKINSVYNIPDMQSSDDAYADVLKMYRAGIMTGGADYSFDPNKNVTSAELSAIFNRAVFFDKRIKTTDTEMRQEKQAYLLSYTPGMDGSKEGIQSGWELDNRAGNVRTTLAGNSTLSDIMDDEKSRLIRHFNLITDDKIDARFNIRYNSGFDGNVVEFCDEDGSAVYRLVCSNGAFNIQNADGTLTEIAKPTEGFRKTYLFRVIVDLEKGISETYINNVFCGKHPLLGGQIKYFAYSTSDETQNITTIGSSYMYSNYAVYENLNLYGAIPSDFSHSGKAAVTNGEFVLPKDSSLSKRFDPISGNTAFCFNTYLADGSSGADFSLKADGKDIVRITTDGGKFYANGVCLKEFSDKLWYKMRIEADTKTQTAIIKVNAKAIATVPFLNATEHFDEISLENKGIYDALADDIRVYNLVDYDVPKPVKPAGSDDYIIGLNICSLWVNGEHYGWGCVSPYSDMKPVLGYYDEGLPESADWENKFMAEHGIDFQAFCWYANQSDAPMKSTGLSAQLDEAYLNSKYGDDVKFCLLWEAANASRPADSDAFRNYYVPYWIENYFSDPRYMTVDNKLVFSIFGADNLINAFGTSLKDEFDYMREEVKKLGYDGMIITASHTGRTSLAAYGFDAWQAYNWGNAGYSVDTNKNSNISTAKSKDVYVIPTISVGFNSIPWHGKRYPLMTAQDYKTAHTWVRDVYLPTYAQNDGKSWNDRLVWLSTWNEYGEGTYIMPSDGLNGFGYLDALREVYTAGGEHTDTVPTEEQKKNITHNYPQDRRILRAYGNYELPDMSYNDAKVVYDFTVKGNFEKYVYRTNMQSYLSTTSAGTTLKTKDTGSNDPIFTLSESMYSSFKADQLDCIRVTASGIPKGQRMQLFFKTSTSNVLSETNSVLSKPSEGTHEQVFELKLTGHKNWKGTINHIRLDPLQMLGVTFTIKDITVVPRKNSGFVALYINDTLVKNEIMAEIDENTGVCYFPFEPGKSLIHIMLYTYHEWDYDTETLKLYRDGKKFVFTAGSDTATVDGVPYKLSGKVYLNDNIPMIPIVDLGEILGFAVTKNGDNYYYETPERYIFDSERHEVGQWEFNLFGSMMEWQADNVAIDYGEGTMIINSDNGDPRIRTSLSGSLGIQTSEYPKIEVRCRWSMDNARSSNIGFYFTTETETNEHQSRYVGKRISQTSDGEFVTMTFDMSSNSGWTGVLKSLRFDCFDDSGVCEVDYIRMLKE